jgi:CheY-like chemotaxis protein/predicted regulator of Ras-like GTPase activity (Roadblock/LC7/MglB family)
MAKVLVVDDSLSVRKVVERALIGRQIEVVCAATGGEALERIERDEPDVIVCDVVMPDKDGYEICEFVKRHPRLSRTPVLLMSGIVNDDVRARAARVQSADVLSKPFAAEDLLRRLEGLLAAEAARKAAQPPAPPTAPVSLPAAGMPGTLPLAAPALNGTNGHAEPAAALPAPPPAPPQAAAPPDALPVLAPMPAPTPARPVAPPPATPPATAASTGSAAILRQFAAIEGVQWAVLADREGFLLDASGDDVVNAEVAGALSACLAESSEGLGRELARGPLQGMMLEYERGMVVLYGVGASALLAVALSEPAVLGKVRYFAKKAVPELLAAV